MYFKMTCSRKGFFSVIGQALSYKSLIDGITELRNSTGLMTEKLLQATICYANMTDYLQDLMLVELEQERLITTSCETMEEFENADAVIWNGFDLLTNSEDMPLMSDYSDLYLDTIEEHTEQYFPEQDSKVLEILDQRLWNSIELPEQEDLVKSKFEEAAYFLGMPNISSTAQEEFLDIVSEFKENGCQNIEDNPTQYYGWIIKEKMMKMSPALRTVLQRGIVIPMSSAEAERYENDKLSTSLLFSYFFNGNS